MSNEKQAVEAASTIGEDDESLRRWAGKLDATEDQIRDAIRAVGSNAGEVEDYLKGSRATTNSERVRKAG
jgi:ABC-type transporter Mla subunit MlaD